MQSVIAYAAAWRGFRRQPVRRAAWRETLSRLNPAALGVGLPEGRLAAAQIEIVLALRSANDR